MTSMVLRDLTLESLIPSVNAPYNYSCVHTTPGGQNSQTVNLSSGFFGAYQRDLLLNPVGKSFVSVVKFEDLTGQC
jgi:hypothetical protein